ncbi:phosphopantetheine-binding protein [Streptomyces sp. NPDC051211]|uniref:acyl carrier protein n=1 Tax=Streptomyces sp. NPDC051211 TaxID=3154643 RepID=UPI00344F65DB
MSDDTDEHGYAAGGRQRREARGWTEGGNRPGTDSERRLARLWADVLGVPVNRIQRTDNFFEIGGTSRAAARLVIALDRHVSINEFAGTHTLTDLAGLLDQRLGVRRAPVTAAVPALG